MPDRSGPNPGRSVRGPSPEPEVVEAQLVDDLRRVRAEERSLEDKLLQIQSQELSLSHKPNGAGAAAVLAGGIGVFTIGFLTTLAAASVGVRNFLDWYSPAGPLSGKTTLGGIVWLVAWVSAHYLLRNKEVSFSRVTKALVVLLAVGLLLMFPPVFELFE
ncbi:MAG: hypothetical protein HY683_10290 [Chloroflexi bacterium]|nr:hypothetical protein [Chloroflexota bacterium]